MMSTTAEQMGTRPAPLPDELSLPFFEAARRGEVLLQRCAQCGAFMWPVKARCVECFAPEPGWVPSSGRGTLYSFAVVHRSTHPYFVHLVPYNIAVVELEEGVRMRTTIVGAQPDQLEIGMPVEVVFERLTADAWLPEFRPVAI